MCVAPFSLPIDPCFTPVPPPPPPRQTLTVPIIDGIDRSTFRYRTVYGGTSVRRGIFEWGMLYKEAPVPAGETARQKHESEPYRWGMNTSQSTTGGV